VLKVAVVLSKSANAPHAVLSRSIGSAKAARGARGRIASACWPKASLPVPIAVLKWAGEVPLK